MNYANIKFNDIANGLGVRTSLFVSGCRNHCKNCFNKETWDFNYGKFFDDEAFDSIVESLKPDHIQGLTILGGEPFEEENQRVIVQIVSCIKQMFPMKDIWIYTGYDFYKDILDKNGKKHTEYTGYILDCVDVIVDGKFVEELKDITLKFRGSSNQRIIDVQTEEIINL